MTTLLIASAIAGLALIVAGVAASRRPAQVEPEFARSRNGYLPNYGQRKPH